MSLKPKGASGAIIYRRKRKQKENKKKKRKKGKGVGSISESAVPATKAEVI